MRDLIARGVADVRRQQGLTQDQVAARFRECGLRAWSRGTVGQLEAGLRDPGFDELLLMARALRVHLVDLLPGDDGVHVKLAEGTEVSAQWIHEMLSGVFWANREGRLLQEGPWEQLPIEAYTGNLELVAEAERLKALLAPIMDWADRTGVERSQMDWDSIFRKSSEAERHAARRLGVEPAQVKFSARLLWSHRDFDDERDRRVGDIEALEPRSRQARRGLVTRQMLAELRAFIQEAYAQGGVQA